MKIGGIEYLVSFLLLLLGFIFGSLTPKTEFFAIGISDVFQIFAAIGTVVAAVIAIPGLNSWRKQFKHSEKIKRLEGLHSIDGAFSALHSYSAALFDYVGGALRNDDRQKYELQVDGARKEYFRASSAYRNSWRGAALAMSAAEIEAFRWSPEKLEALYMELGEEILLISHDQPFRAGPFDKRFTRLFEEHNLNRITIKTAVGEAHDDIDDLIRANL